MTDELLDKFMIFFLTAIFCSIFWVLILDCNLFGNDQSWRSQIVEHGCAEFYLDQAHERQWRWK